MRIWYITREALKASLDQPLTARNDRQVDSAIAAASLDAEGLLGRRFYPEQKTYSLPAPRGCTLFVDAHLDTDLIDVESITAAGVAVDLSTVTLAPVDGPPYDAIEFEVPPARGQLGRPIDITGPWGYDNVTEPAGTLAAAVGTTSVTTVDTTDSSSTGVGSLLSVGSERMVVTDRTMLDTGQTLQTALAAQTGGRSFDVGDGDEIHVGEVLLVDAERLLVTDVAGDTVVVRRAWDGTVLAAHDPGAPVYALRRLTVVRGVLGTTAATHNQGTAAAVQVYPGPLVALVTALSQVYVLQQLAGQQHELPQQGGDKTVLEAAIARAQSAIGRNSGFA